MEQPLGVQISRMLQARGVEVVFGIPGVHNQELYRGIEAAGITHVLARHEQGAGFMADGYARATGEAGVCYVITGPGVCNIMTPMGQAYSDSVPMLVISSCLDEVANHRGQLHQMKDQRAAAEAVCDWSEEARTPRAAYGLIDRALLEFALSRKRPKHIQVPISALEGAAPAPPEPVDLDSSLLRSAVDLGKLDRTAERLIAAKRPVFIFGGGVAQEGTQRALTRLAERFGAAVLTSYAGRGAVAPEYPLLLGAGLARPGSADLLAQSDCVVVFGCDLAEVDVWRDPIGLPDGATVHVNLDPEVLAKAAPRDTRVHCDVLDAAFRMGAPAGLPASSWSAEEVAATRARWRAEVDAEFRGVLPVMEALRAAMPKDAMIYSDMTQFAYVANELWDMPRAGHWHHPSGFGTLGYALPASIGGAVARRGKPTVCIIGDYGIQYTVAELATAVELALPLPVILWDNGKLGEIEDSMVRAQIAPNAVIQRNPDFLALAKAYGAYAVQPAKLADIGPALTAAFKADAPTVIRLTPALAA